MSKKFLVGASVILGIIFLIIAGFYFARTAGSLPTFFPGHQTGSNTVHRKHGLAAVIVAAALFIYSWFASGKKQTA